MHPIQSIDSRDDAAQGRGHAILSLKGVAALPAPCRLLISRGSGARAEYLGAQGWQSTRAHIIPDGVREQSGQLEIHLGPAVVQHMARGNFSLTLVAGNERSEPKAFAWKVAPFRSTRDNLTVSVEEAEGDEAGGGLAGGAVPPPASSPASAPPSSPVVAAAAASPSPLWAPPADMAVSTSSGNKTWLVIAAVAVVLALVLAIAYWLLMGRDQAEPVAEPPPAPAVTPEPPAVVEPAPEAEPPAAPEPPAVVEPPVVVEPPAVAEPPASGAPRSTADEEVRQFLATAPSVEEIVAKADEMLQREQPGLALTLYRRASDAGSADALVSLARLYDPSETHPGITEKRPQFAYNFYRQALAQGHADAAAAIAQLKQWASEQAATGNREAAQLLRLIALEN